MALRYDILKDRRTGWLAIIGPAIALGVIAICVIASPWFTWENNAISDFGVHELAVLFNASLVACGAMAAIFAVSVLLRLRAVHARIGMLMMFLASISLMGIGIFHENIRPWHFYFSVAFFVLLLLACLLFGTYLLGAKRTRYIGIFALLTAIVGIIGWSIDWGPGVAIPEALTFVPGGIWFMLLGYWVLNRKPAD